MFSSCFIFNGLGLVFLIFLLCAVKINLETLGLKLKRKTCWWYSFNYIQQIFELFAVQGEEQDCFQAMGRSLWGQVGKWEIQKLNKDQIDSRLYVYLFIWHVMFIRIISLFVISGILDSDWWACEHIIFFYIWPLSVATNLPHCASFMCVL